MITIENYEEYFLLYVDNELPAELRAAVEQFAADHPQAGEELEAMLQCRLRPDQQDAYPDKRELLHEPMEETPSDTTIMSRIFDESLLSYIDGELDEQERTAVETLVQQKPAAAEELRRLRLTVNRPDTAVVFPDKESLYRYEKQRRVIALPWLRVGAAAAVLAVTALLLLPHGQKERMQPAVAIKKVPAAVTPSNPRTLYIQKAETAGKEKAVFAVTKEKPGRPAVRSEENGSTGTSSLKEAIPVIAQTKASADSGSRPTGVTIAAINADKGKPVVPENAVAMLNIPRDQSSFATQALLQEAQEQEAGDQLAMTMEPSGKNKFRGIFRKVTRAFGKTADRDNDGQREVLISAFQVALK